MPGILERLKQAAEYAQQKKAEMQAKVREMAGGDAAVAQRDIAFQKAMLNKRAALDEAAGKQLFMARELVGHGPGGDMRRKAVEKLIAAGKFSADARPENSPVQGGPRLPFEPPPKDLGDVD